ncbi:MAG: TIGR03986 family CRISPR-associated RAMP protein [Microcoleus sp. PH2017_10_PVI_O_A]|uniref:TIGR03986 family type III CRISPR-associated RAMP protein n=1 Tax=unclassified Microcoleus TaxID=2642155 RepID=UPI001DC8C8F8|nr:MULTISPECIES: TIGR03986 family CRISPR-associated RAMP protein [unclassified Microcoleus]TAE77476.1 MAG: TIGR03986 family CRISPR-associated RAMP protein [Oscillatoriales cyanobacterium]MCC3406026.1 TIGR03986 family CRISPR-associated RAMP protein [Microcoleus sp. PH2017_10_PVI_O_A]MCC3460227.1 TIGR03986 family CRISPR-associated RAMP protein [Microcoleus sp. PH2017_11_PCY_U_A]MCC3478649.1 TIGR03986 family CRISPR-associated RAMP protein [Microcoleus sp. PH2017_12_PCY_D_A]MCC3530004.1 TIGR03986 
MNPKHLENVPDNRRAVAPYNFVELPEKIVPAEPIPTHNCYHDDRHTGKIKCTLTTSSPLYIRCGMSPTDFAKFGGKSDEDLTDEQKKEKREILAPFFENPANQYPTIPGSSLRGMFRTIIEIVSYSKIDKVSDLQLIYRAFADTTSLGKFYRDRLLQEEGERQYSFLMQAGYMVPTQQGSGWAIKPAKNLVEGASFAKIESSQIKNNLVKSRWYDIKHASKVTVHVEAMTWHSHRGGFIELYYAKAVPTFGHHSKCQGVLVETGGMPGKKKMECVIGLPDDEATLIPIPDYPDSMLQDYKEQLTKEQKKLLCKDGVLKHMHPVFYLMEEGKLVFFGHTMMFRLPYKDSIQNFIPEANYQFIPDYPYNSPTLDLTEAIFGFVRDTKQKENQTQAGRVFVSDAKCKQSSAEDIWLKGDITKPMTSKILASPKPTTFQHYLVQDSAVESELMHYASQPNNETVIRGHKLYWHKGSVEESQIEESNTKKIEEARSQYTDIKPITKNVSFDFTICFENLSAVELGALLWVLYLAASPIYRLSLGMGKPLGMGAVEISSQLSLTNREKRYCHLFQDIGWATGEKNHVDINEVKQDCLQKFEDYILHHTDPKLKRLHDVPRIKSLLGMLQWPGVAENSSRYMEIERKQQPCIGELGIGELGKNGKANEYKKRPVLPTSSQVIKDNQKRNYPGSPPPSSGGGSNRAAWQRPK